MEKKIKIIDILCCISTGDYDMLPKKIKYEEIEWNLDTNNYCKADYTDGNQYMIADYIDKHFIIQEILNDEVEILDEEDEFEDIEWLDVALLGQCDNWLRCPTNEVTKQDIELNPYIINNIRENTLEFQHKINELIKNQKKIIERLKDE